MSIAYYISSHGFGHAARQHAVLRLLSQRGIPVYVRSAAPHKFFDFPGVQHHVQAYDVGLIQPDALHVDVPASIAAYQSILDDAASIIAGEVAFIRANNIRLVVGDMPPLAFEIAHQAGVPSVAITHFTWDWVYAHYAADYPQLEPIIAGIRAMYGKTTLALQLPFAHPFDMFPNVQPHNLLANTVTRTRAQICTELNIAPDDKLALLSMGGMTWRGGGIDRLAQFTGWTFLVTPSIWEASDQPANFRHIPTDYPDYHNLIAAADVVVGKAGGSTVAECVAHHTASIYTIRDDYRENELLDAALRTYTHSQFIQKTAFEAGAWVDWLEPILARDEPLPALKSDGAAQAAALLAKMIS